MSSPAPPPDRLGLVERGVDVVKNLTVTNVLMAAMIVVLAVPSYFAWKFMTDTDFRHEFWSTAKTVPDAGVPCLVVLGNLTGQGDKYTVGATYWNEGLEERMIAIRMPFVMSNAEIKRSCDTVHEQIAIMRGALAAKEKPP